MFTPVETTVGALLLHLATTTLLFDSGVILGASGFLRKLMKEPKNELTQSSTIWFFSGMAAAVGLTALSHPRLLPTYPILQPDISSILRVIGTGFLTGWGTKNCGGCTSGHMLCGVARLSPRSVLATAIFFPTALVMFHLTNPSLETMVCGYGTPCYQPSYPNPKTIGVLAAALATVFGLAVIQRRRSDQSKDTAAINKNHSLAGLAFGLGLLISGMASPAKVQAFFAARLVPLDLNRWDPSMLLVVAFALLPNILRIQGRGFEKPPRLASRFSLPTKTLRDVDARFILGAVAFGVSWGWTGVCPGPAILRAFLQPIWGALWMAGFYAGSLEML